MLIMRLKIILSRMVCAAAFFVVFDGRSADTSSHKPKRMAELAAEILGDQTLRDVHQIALDTVKDGLNPGRGYEEVWIRDLNTFIELGLEVYPRAGVREALLNFIRLQGDDGNIVDGYIPGDKARAGYAYRTNALAPGLMAHKNTVETDQESSLVQAVRRYVALTGNRTILEAQIGGRTVRESLGHALEYVLKERLAPKYGLVWGGTTADWGDVQPESPWGVALDEHSHRALSIYDNAMLVIALNDYLELLGKHSAEAAHWRAERDALKKNIRKYLWDAKRQKFIPHVYLEGSPFPKDFEENTIYYHGGTAVAIEAGLLTRREAARALEKMVADTRAAGAASIGLAMYPPYPEGFFLNPAMRHPYSYQNGGDWDWFGGRMIQDLVREGHVEEAYRELRPMVERVKRVGAFYEWWSRDNQPQGSKDYRGSAGVVGKAIEMLQDWAKAHQTDSGKTH